MSTICKYMSVPKKQKSYYLFIKKLCARKHTIQYPSNPRLPIILKYWNVKKSSSELNARVISNPSIPITRQSISRLHPGYTRVATTHLQPQFDRTKWWVSHVPHCSVGLTHGPPLLGML